MPHLARSKKIIILNLIYDHKKVFSFHNEDLGFCTKLAHSISTTTDIKYRSGKSNQAADALSHCPTTDIEILSNTESDEYKTILYAVVCDDLSEVIKGEKLPLDLKRAVQIEISQEAPDSRKINVHSEMVDVLSRVTPHMMKEAQEEDIDISKMICYV